MRADAAFEAAYVFGEKLGKRPIRCHDTPGFAVNRVLIPLLNDCVRVLDEARVSAEDIDARDEARGRWKCELLDLIGIDVHVHASEALWAKLREPRMAAPPRLVAMANAGLLGRKTRTGLLHVLGGEPDHGLDRLGDGEWLDRRSRRQRPGSSSARRRHGQGSGISEKGGGARRRPHGGGERVDPLGESGRRRVVCHR